jgi:hypothetical protein
VGTSDPVKLGDVVWKVNVAERDASVMELGGTGHGRERVVACSRAQSERDWMELGKLFKGPSERKRGWGVGNPAGSLRLLGERKTTMSLLCGTSCGTMSWGMRRHMIGAHLSCSTYFCDVKGTSKKSDSCYNRQCCDGMNGKNSRWYKTKTPRL